MNKKNILNEKEIIFLSEIKNKTKENYFENPLLCKTCFNNRIGLVFFPCTHACICSNCYEKLSIPKECPICRINIVRTEKILFPSE